MPKRPTTTGTSATEAYGAARNEIARLLDVLDMELATHGERAYN